MFNKTFIWYILFSLISLRIFSTELPVIHGAVPWIRQALASASPHRPTFNRRPVHVGFLAEKVPLEFLQIIQFSSVSTNPPMAQSYFIPLPLILISFIILAINSTVKSNASLSRSLTQS